MIILLTRKQWELNQVIKWSKEELDQAEKDSEGFIGYWYGAKCILQKFTTP